MARQGIALAFFVGECQTAEGDFERKTRRRDPCLKTSLCPWIYPTDTTNIVGLSAIKIASDSSNLARLLELQAISHNLFDPSQDMWGSSLYPSPD